MDWPRQRVKRFGPVMCVQRDSENAAKSSAVGNGGDLVAAGKRGVG